MKAILQWEVTKFFLSVPLGPTAKFHNCGRKCCWGEWGLLSRGSCTLTQKEGGFPLLKLDSRQWGDKLQCHTQKTRIKALLAWLTAIPSSWAIQQDLWMWGHLCHLEAPAEGWVQATTPRKAEPCTGSGMDRAGHRGESASSSHPSLGAAEANPAPLGDQTYCSQFCLYLAHQPLKGCWLRDSACASSNLPGGQGWDCTSGHVQGSGW